MDDVVPEAETLLRPIKTNINTAEEEKCHQVEPKEGEGEGEGEEEKKGGILDQIISLVSPRAGASNHQVQGFGESETQQVGNGTQETGEAAAKGGGGGGSNLFQNLISHLSTSSLPDDAAPTTDEASILIHSIVHD